jgi:hypothetical protein
MNVDDLQGLLDHANLRTSELGPQELARLWALVGVDDEQRFDEFLDAITPVDGNGLPLRIGHWRIDLTETAVRTSVLTALVSGVLIPNGFSEFAVGFTTAILPSVIEIERVELGAGDRRLLVELRARQDLGTEEALYDALPGDVKLQINRYDFADFIARLRDLGLADGRPGGAIRLRAPD